MKIKQKIISLVTASVIAFSGLLSSGSFAAVDTGPDDGVDNSIPFTETSHDEESDCDNYEIINGSSVTLA